MLARRRCALGEMGTYPCQNEMQRLPRLDFFNEFSDAMKSSENCHLFCHWHQIYCCTRKQTREMTFSLSCCVVMNQNQQVWQNMLPAFCLIMEHTHFTPARHDGLWCQTARGMTWIKCRMTVFKHSCRSSVRTYKKHQQSVTYLPANSWWWLKDAKMYRSPKTENDVLIMA